MGLDAASATMVKPHTNFIEGEKYYLEYRGKDHIGVTEFFQYHDEFIREKQLGLSNTDKFFRQGFGPMHLMDFQFFNNLIDDFAKWSKK